MRNSLFNVITRLNQFYQSYYCKIRPSIECGWIFSFNKRLSTALIKFVSDDLIFLKNRFQVEFLIIHFDFDQFQLYSSSCRKVHTFLSMKSLHLTRIYQVNAEYKEVSVHRMVMIRETRHSKGHILDRS